MNKLCKEIVFRGFWFTSCGRPAKRDGFCGIHHPDAVAKMRAKSEERYARKNAELDAKRNAAIRASKLAELAERLIPLIKFDTTFGSGCLAYFGGDKESQDILRELYEMRKQ